LHAVACVGKDFSDQPFELDQLLFGHGSLQIDWPSALRPLIAVGPGIRTRFAMQEGDATHAIGLALRRSHPFLPGALVPAGLSSRILSTGTAAAARTFRSRRG